MKCSDLQFNLTLYADGFLSEAGALSVKSHLEVCPLCRQRHADYREIGTDLRHLRRPEMSPLLGSRLKERVRDQRRIESRSILPLTNDIRDWLQMRLLPYSVGVSASLLIGFTFLTMMFSGMLQRVPTSLTKGPDETVMLASNRTPLSEADAEYISPSTFAESRMAFASESPSINTQGALVALTKSLIRGGMKDDEVVVVAEVFRDGLARITEVVEPSQDREAINELEKAFRSGSADSPFVPTAIENRPDNMTIVLRFQTVDVSTSSKQMKRRS